MLEKTEKKKRITAIKPMHEVTWEKINELHRNCCMKYERRKTRIVTKPADSANRNAEAEAVP